MSLSVVKFAFFVLIVSANNVVIMFSWAQRAFAFKAIRDC